MKKYGLGFLTFIAAGFIFFSSISVSAQYSKDKKAEKDIVDTAVAAGQFTVLAKALQAADLVDVLKSKDKFTVFAPTDAAFAKLPAGTIDELLKPENKDKLKAILLYHVVKNKVPASEVGKLNGKTVGTVQGGTLKIDTSTGVMVNNASVVKADVMASNGVIHVIDTVLLPTN